MTTNTAAQVSNATSTLRDWHKAADIQAFIKALNDGQVPDDNGKLEAMSGEATAVILSHIDTKAKFIDMVKEYEPDHVLEGGYDIFTVESETLYVENSEALLSHANPTWVKSKSDQVEFLYDIISNYGIGEIRHEDINDAFFEGNRESDRQSDAWHMGYSSVIGIALHRLFVAYAIYTGITVVEPAARKIERVKHRFLLNKDSAGSVEVDLISDRLVGEEALMDTDVMIGGQVLFVMDGSCMVEFREDFRAMAEKYRI